MRKNERNSDVDIFDSGGVFSANRRPYRRGDARRLPDRCDGRPFAALLISSKSSQTYYVTAECTNRRNSMQYSPSPGASLCHYSYVPRDSPPYAHFPFRYQPTCACYWDIVFSRRSFSHRLADLPLRYFSSDVSLSCNHSN